jgi:hypothetical protein
MMIRKRPKGIIDKSQKSKKSKNVKKKYLKDYLKIQFRKNSWCPIIIIIKMLKKCIIRPLFF